MRPAWATAAWPAAPPMAAGARWLKKALHNTRHAVTLWQAQRRPNPHPSTSMSTSPATHPAHPTSPRLGAGNRSPVTPEQTAAAWAFVRRNYASINKFAWKLAASDHRLTGEELLSEAVLWIARNHRSHDAARGMTESTWAYYLVRRARQDLTEKLNRQRSREVPLVLLAGLSPERPDVDEASATVLGDEGRAATGTVARLRIAAVLRHASDEELACAQSVLDDHDEAEAIDFLGPQLARNRRQVVRRLAAHTTCHATRTP